MTIEGDYSQAAFLAVLGCVLGGVTVTGLNPESKQGDKVIMDILQRCGGKCKAVDGGLKFGRSLLKATEIDLADYPDLGPILFTLGCFLPLEMPEVAPVLRWTAKGLTLLSAGLVLYCALVYGVILLAFGYSGGERVLEYRGQTLVEVDDSFLDPIYNYYEYHGPLVRGKEPVYKHQHSRLDGGG